MSDLRLSSAAVADLRGIRIYSKRQFGTAAARSYLLDLQAAFERLGARPLAGKRERDLGEDIRSFRYVSHRIYYRTAGPVIEIVRVLHQAQDAATAFGGNG